MKPADTLPRDERRDAVSDSPQEQADGRAPSRRSGYGLRVAVRRTARSLMAIWPSAVAVVVLLLLWQGYVVASGVNQQLLPTPGAVWNALATQRQAIWDNMLVTLWETVIGFGVALATGILFGVAIDLSPWLRRALYPLLVATQAVPLIALAPLLVLWFGPGMTSKAIVVTLMCFFPIVVALADGLRGADPELIKLFRSFGAGPVRIFWSVRLPGALPALFSGVRIAIAYSVIGAIIAEYVGAVAGLGFYMTLKQHSFSTAGVLATFVVTALLSFALFALVALVERLVLPWYYTQGRASGV
ncbi:MAG TPA: ABC transporter permease [Ktedonobacterales bacterium]|nr:ABC transporter permease [Ktedonobacterales bacterium]